MKNLKINLKSQKAITLITLVITIIILLILAGITIATLTGNNNLFGKAKQSKEETEKQTATETMNLKITAIQMDSYTKTQSMPTLQMLANELCLDDDIQSVSLKEKKEGTNNLPKIEVGESDSILTKLKKYPYIFEINSSLQLASIDGIKVSTVPSNDNNTIVSMTKKELEDLIDSKINSITPSTPSTNPEPTNNKTYKETLLFSGNVTSGNITFLDNHNIDEFDSLVFVYGLLTNGKPTSIMNREYRVSTWNFAMTDGNQSVNYLLEINGYASRNMEFNNLTKTGFKIAVSNAYCLFKIYGINY